MDVTLRTVSNTGDPITNTTGMPKANTEVTFTLVDERSKKTISLFDAVSGELILGSTVSVITDPSGILSVPLWPNVRGESATCYRVFVDDLSIKPFYIKVPEGAGNVSLVACKANMSAVTAQTASLLDTAVASANATIAEASAAAESALAISSAAEVLATTAADNLIEAVEAKTSALASAEEAALSATISTIKATESAASAVAAESAASSAIASKIIAVSSASTAVSSALSLDAALISFRSTFLGHLTTDPLLDGNGNPLMDGVSYVNSASNKIRVYDLPTDTWSDYDASIQSSATSAALSAAAAAGSASTAASDAVSAGNSAALALVDKNSARVDAMATSLDRTAVETAKGSVDESVISASLSEINAATSAAEAALSRSDALSAAGSAAVQAGVAGDKAAEAAASAEAAAAASAVVNSDVTSHAALTVTAHGGLLQLGISPTTAAPGNHTHAGAYAPILGGDDNYVTDAEKVALHSHSNKAALDQVAGVNTGDQVIPETLPASDVYPWAKVDVKPIYTAAEVGLGNVNNTSDADKPISMLTATALSSKADLVAGVIPSSQLPAYVDDVLEYGNLAAFPATGESGKVYIAIDTNCTYRWAGTVYAAIGSDLALGETSSTACRGDYGNTAYLHSQSAHAPSGAEANVNADWNAVSGAAQVLNKPTLGTMAAVNDVLVDGRQYARKDGSWIEVVAADSTANIDGGSAFTTFTIADINIECGGA
jgi:hypothetical protein